jgi:hypothetical protein
MSGTSLVQVMAGCPPLLTLPGPEGPAHLTGELGVFRWTCQACGEVVSDRGPSGRSPAEDEPGHAEGCQRIAAAVAEWLAQGD